MAMAQVLGVAFGPREVVVKGRAGKVIAGQETHDGQVDGTSEYRAARRVGEPEVGVGHRRGMPP